MGKNKLVDDFNAFTYNTSHASYHELYDKGVPFPFPLVVFERLER